MIYKNLLECLAISSFEEESNNVILEVPQLNKVATDGKGVTIGASLIIKLDAAVTIKV